MANKVKLPLLLLLLSLCLASGSSLFLYESDDLKEELSQCVSDCQTEKKTLPSVMMCGMRCLEEIKEGRRESPRREFEQCQRRCQRGQRGQREQQQCQERCREELREREREEHRQRGRDDNPERDPRGREFEQCQESCQRRRGWRQQQRCRERCQREFQGQDDNPQRREPQWEYQQCRERCQTEEKGQREQQRCLSRCRRESEERQREHEGQWGGDNPHHREDPEQEFKQCQRRCQERREGRRSERQCMQQCEEEFRRHRREHGRETHRASEEEEQSNSPYYFQSQRFQSRFRSEDGHIRVLQKFTERSELLRGIENYRLAVVDANPNTFVVPHHNDAQSVIVCLKGRGTITLVTQNNKESFNLERGDVINVPAGTTVYLINRDNEEKLKIAKLLQPINVPGLFKEYSMVGRQNPQSYFSVFSSEILETALQTPRDQLENLFGKQREGMIIRASQQQLRALSQHVSAGRQKGSKFKGPINLWNQKPLYSNEYGQFFEICADEYEQLRQMDLHVTAIEINEGSMMLPHYNSKVTGLILVEEGNGEIEMVCPHVSMESQGRQRGGELEEEEEISGKFHKVTARVSPGDIFVMPAGHPTAVVASQNQNLRLITFGINAQNNQRNFLAGQENMINQIDTEALAIAFNNEGRRVQQVFQNQQESYFAPGPRQSTRRETALESILDFVGF